MINRMPNDMIFEAAQVVFEEARKDDRRMAFAVADEAGGLLFGTLMEGASTRILRVAMRKAYTSAVMQRDTIVLRDQDREMGKTLADWGDPMFTHLVGGVVIRKDDEWWGGAAVGGNSTERDDEVARIALKVLLSG